MYPSFDGTLLREGVNETFNTIRSATNATTVDTTNTAYSVSYLATSTTSNQFYRLIRSIFVFDTSSLGSGATVTSATLSLYTNTAVVGYAKGDPYPGPPTIGSSNTVVVAASPASDTALQASDYSTLGSTAFGSISWAAWSAVANAENVIALNASGLAAINRTGNTRLGTTIEWDRSGSFTGTWASFTPSFVVANSRNVAGTSYDPKLVINYLR